MNDLPFDIRSKGNVYYFTTDVVSYRDYYPYGMVMPNRNASSGDYRYGYQGSEKDDEVKGNGNSYTTHFRMYDPRVARWLSIDPKGSLLPWESPYSSMANSPILLNDPLGDYIKWGMKMGKSRRELRADIRNLKRTVPGFRTLWKSWRSDNDRHTIFGANNSHPTDGSATPENPFSFIRTNSDHSKIDNRRGTGEPSTKQVLKRNKIEEVTREINKTVTDHHHYIGTPNPQIHVEEFEVQFELATNKLITDLVELKDYIGVTTFDRTV